MQEQLLKQKLKECFNTSIVSVKWFSGTGKSRSFKTLCFNTSIVSVKLIEIKLTTNWEIEFQYFNCIG